MSPRLTREQALAHIKEACADPADHPCTDLEDFLEALGYEVSNAEGQTVWRKGGHVVQVYDAWRGKTVPRAAMERYAQTLYDLEGS